MLSDIEPGNAQRLRPGEARGDAARASNNYTRKLFVGPDVALRGAISSCDLLSIKGRVEATLTGCKRLEIEAEGAFDGDAEVEEAEISGQFAGRLVAATLKVRASARITGDVAYASIEIERGGTISGRLNATQQAAREDRRSAPMVGRIEDEPGARIPRAPQKPLASPAPSEAEIKP